MKMNKKSTFVFSILFLILLISINYISIFANSTESSKYYFKGLLKPFNSYNQYLEEKSINDDAFKFKEAILFYYKGSIIFAKLTNNFIENNNSDSNNKDNSYKKSDDSKRLYEINENELKKEIGFNYIDKALNYFEKKWKKDKSDPFLNYLYAQCLMSYVGYIYQFKIKKISLNKIQNIYFKAKNLVNLSIMKLPENIDLRFFRISITFKMPKDVGMRPDEQILKDADIFIKNFKYIDEKDIEEYRVQLNFIYLIKSMILYDNKRKDEARSCFLKVQSNLLKVKIYSDIYDDMKKKLKIK